MNNYSWDASNVSDNEQQGFQSGFGLGGDIQTVIDP